MTHKKYQDLYREAWKIQAKKDKLANPALRLSQKPIKAVGGSKESGARGGRSKPRPYALTESQLNFF
tara:strand:- start:282 stop:482 length:201 start_codon:yes stop_codon:yes gene_type:complete